MKNLFECDWPVQIIVNIDAVGSMEAGKNHVIVFHHTEVQMQF